MVDTIVRCPGHFFDTTPSGVLTNKFSNDLGVLDNALYFSFIFAFEGPLSSLFALINVAQLNLLLIPAIVVVLFVGIAFFVYSRKVLIQCKQKDLKNKSPIFHFYNETITGLVQVKTYHRRRSLIE